MPANDKRSAHDGKFTPSARFYCGAQVVILRYSEGSSSCAGLCADPSEYLRTTIAAHRTLQQPPFKLPFPAMSLAEINWFSQTLEKMVATSVILPDVGKPPFATYYLLHGLSDDHTAWRRRSRIEWYVRELPLIVVMADG